MVACRLFIANSKRKPAAEGEQSPMLKLLTYIEQWYLLWRLYRYGNKITHKIEVSWNEAWSGAYQQRFVEIKDNQLTIKTQSSVR